MGSGLCATNSTAPLELPVEDMLQGHAAWSRTISQVCQGLEYQSTHRNILPLTSYTRLMKRIMFTAFARTNQPPTPCTQAAAVRSGWCQVLHTKARREPAARIPPRKHRSRLGPSLQRTDLSQFWGLCAETGKLKV